MTETPIGQALYEEAQRRILANFKVKDWRAGVETSLNFRVEAMDQLLFIAVSTNDREMIAKVHIEVDGAGILLHAYDEEHDEPVTLTIRTDNITVSANRSR